MIIDIIADSFIDSIKLVPFLFVTYLIMECLEHKAGDKMQAAIRGAGKSDLLSGVFSVFFLNAVFRRRHRTYMQAGLLR